jgi:alkylhydroperoxidase family enzyme
MVGSRLRTILAWTSLVVTLVAIVVVVVQTARAEGGTPETVFVLVLAVGLIGANLAQLVVKARPRLRQ